MGAEKFLDLIEENAILKQNNNFLQRKLEEKKTEGVFDLEIGRLLTERLEKDLQIKENLQKEKYENLNKGLQIELSKKSEETKGLNLRHERDKKKLENVETENSRLKLQLQTERNQFEKEKDFNNNPVQKELKMKTQENQNLKSELSKKDKIIIELKSKIH